MTLVLLAIIPVLMAIRGIVALLFTSILTLFTTALQWKAIWIPQPIYLVWGFIRDFVNLFFILGLIVMAFGTIFDIKKYTYREMLVPLLTAALLINFSMTVGKYVVQVSNDLSGMFLTTVQDATGGVGNIFANGFSLGKIAGSDAGADPEMTAKDENGNTIVGAFWKAAGCIEKLAACYIGTVANLSMSIIFMFFATFAILASIIFMIIRVPVVWMLLMLSPIAWLGYAFPAIRQAWSEWWSWLLSWAFWLPSYLAIMMLLALILKAKGENQTNFFASMNSGVGDTILQFLGLNDLLYFAITLLFIVGGIWLSFQIGKVFKHGAGGAGGWAMSQLANTRIPGTNRTLTSEYQGRARGAAARWKDYQERGGRAIHPALAFLEGDRDRKLREAGVAQRYGEHHAVDEARAEIIKKEKERLLHNNPGMIRADSNRILADAITNNDDATRLAIAQIRAERGWLDPGAAGATEISDTIQRLGGAQTKAGGEYMTEALKHIDAEASTELMTGTSALGVNTIQRDMLLQKRAEEGWTAVGTPGTPNAAEIREALERRGGAESVSGKKYLETLKDKKRLSQEVVDAMFRGLPGTTMATGAEHRFLAQLRAEKGWAQDSAEIETIAGELQGEEKKKYLAELEKNNFETMAGDLRTGADKVRLATAATTDASLRKKLYLNALRNKQLATTAEINDAIVAFASDDKETRDAVMQHAADSIQMVARTYDERSTLVATAPDDNIRRAVAIAMIDAGEVKDLDTVDAIENAAHVLGPGHPKVVEMHAKIAKDNKFLQAELDLRSGAIPLPEFQNRVTQEMASISPKDLVTKTSSSASHRNIWNNPNFITATVGKLGELQRIDGPRAGFQGKGRAYLSDLERAATGNPEIMTALRTIRGTLGW